MGQAWTVADGFGLEKRWRQAAVTALIPDVLDRVARNGDRSESAETWSVLIDHFIDMASNRKLFLLHERNFMAMQGLEQSEHHEAEHEDLAQVMRSFFASPDIPVSQRVRMASSIGAVMSVLMGAGEMFADVPTAELAGLVRDAVHDLLGPADERARHSGVTLGSGVARS